MSVPVPGSERPVAQPVAPPELPGRATIRFPGRALLLGVLGVALLCAATPYNNFKLKNTFLYGNHLPVGALFLFFLLLFGVNPVLRRRAPRWVLQPSELLLVWAMWTAGAGLAGPALWRTLGPIVVVPAYFAGAGRKWLDLFADAPGWLLLSRDPESRAVVAFYQGLQPHETVPWGQWVPVLIGWGIGFACVMAYSLGACALFRRQWQERERLSFPLAQLPLLLVADAQERAPLTRNRLFRIGAAVVVFHHTVATLHAFYPSVPDLPASWDILAWQQTPPWNALDIWFLGIYFAAVGAVFLIPAEVSFSLWSIYLALHLFRVLRRMYGHDPTISGPIGQEAALGVGAFIVWTAWLLWLARAHWQRVWRAVLRPRSVDESSEPIPARPALLLTLGGLAGALLWMRAATVPWHLALAFVALLAVILLILTRNMAETGMLFLFPPFDPSQAMAAFGLTGWTPAAAGTLLMTEQVYADYREAPMPALINAFALARSPVASEARESGAIHPRMFGYGVGLALLVGFFVGFVAFVWVSYTYGSVTLDPWGTEGAPAYRFDRALNFVDPHAGPAPIESLIAIGVGGFLAIALAYLKSRFLWWPLGPVGLTLAGTYAMDCFWFSVFTGWACKVVTLRFGGLRSFRTVLPFFLGLIVGESLFAGITILWGLATGISTPQFLPG
jgi:hypothetical protein